MMMRQSARVGLELASSWPRVGLELASSWPRVTVLDDAGGLLPLDDAGGLLLES
jgi:hypothetical protein